MALRRLVVVVISASPWSTGKGEGLEQQCRVRSIYPEMDINVWLADYMRGCVLSFSYLDFLAARHFAVVCSTTSASFAACKGASPETVVQMANTGIVRWGSSTDKKDMRWQVSASEL
ncbi:hypothetical protein EV401DRAFT_1894879 [Pisolithus croceorrhizus]|nr:hypothetical protein EV401DRAFT_1894879 [Pisolithus croceorrhizus]